MLIRIFTDVDFHVDEALRSFLCMYAFFNWIENVVHVERSIQVKVTYNIERRHSNSYTKW